MDNELIALCFVDEIPEGTAKGFSLTSDSQVQDIFLINRNNRFYAYKNSCPHTGVTLNWQPDVYLDFEEVYIQCAVHGARFEVETGFCVWGPCVNQSLEAIAIKVERNKIYLQDGVIHR